MLRSHSTVRSHVFRKLFMETVLFKGKKYVQVNQAKFGSFLMEKRGCWTVKVMAIKP